MTKRSTDGEWRSRRAELRAKIQERFGRKEGEPDLAELISESFAYLVTEFGYLETDARRTGWHNSATLKEYVLPDRKIGVWAGDIDSETFCGVFFQRTGPNCSRADERVHDFRTLAAARDSSFSHPRFAESAEIAREHIQKYAKALKEIGEDIIVGDFRLFDD